MVGMALPLRTRPPEYYGSLLFPASVEEGQNIAKWKKLSCRTFKDNQTRHELFALACRAGRVPQLRRRVARRLVDVAGACLVYLAAAFESLGIPALRERPNEAITGN